MAQVSFAGTGVRFGDCAIRMDIAMAAEQVPTRRLLGVVLEQDSWN